MYEINAQGIKEHLRKAGLKQKVVAENSGIGEVKLSLVLQGNRKFRKNDTPV